MIFFALHAVFFGSALNLSHAIHPETVQPLVPAPSPSISATPSPTPLPEVTELSILPMKLEQVARGFEEITDGTPLPGGKSGRWLILEKRGRIRLWDETKGLTFKDHPTVAQFDVPTASEQGLLGIALDPAFVKSKKLFIHRNEKDGATSKVFSRISEWEWDEATSTLQKERLVLRVEQPSYGNHKGGQLAFGPDGFLYVGLGDGGSAGDPQGHAQNCMSLLGKMLRISPMTGDDEPGYRVPTSNPFYEKEGCLPPIFALGLRNPWRFSFDTTVEPPRLWVADVGQANIEEINWVTAGSNYGWNAREGSRCYKPKKNCPTDSTPPIFEYTHQLGQSITGGFVVTDRMQAQLYKRYVFSDFITGRVWALDPSRVASHRQVAVGLVGKFPIQIATFLRTPTGDLRLTDFAEGGIYRLVPK